MATHEAYLIMGPKCLMNFSAEMSWVRNVRTPAERFNHPL